MLVLLMLSTTTNVEYTTKTDCVGLTVQCEVSTPLHVASSLQVLIALGPNTNDGLTSVQNTVLLLLALAIGHNMP